MKSGICISMWLLLNDDCIFYCISAITSELQYILLYIQERRKHICLIFNFKTWYHKQKEYMINCQLCLVYVTDTDFIYLQHSDAELCVNLPIYDSNTTGYEVLFC